MPTKQSTNLLISTVNKFNTHTEDATVCSFTVGVSPDSLNSAKSGVAIQLKVE